MWIIGQYLVESVVVGPACLARSDLHHLLGVNGATFRLDFFFFLLQQEPLGKP